MQGLFSEAISESVPLKQILIIDPKIVFISQLKPLCTIDYKEKWNFVHIAFLVS
jgi:hypothetical protein